MKISALWLDSLETDGIKEKFWIGFDLDGTLAKYNGYNEGLIGAPIPEMMERVKCLISKGIRVKIFTARASDLKNIPPIKEWLRRYGFGDLEITNVKDRYCDMIYDDRAVQVEFNTGKLLGDPSLIKGVME